MLDLLKSMLNTKVSVAGLTIVLKECRAAQAIKMAAIRVRILPPAGLLALAHTMGGLGLYEVMLCCMMSIGSS